LLEYRGVELWADTNLDGSLSSSEKFVDISGKDFGNSNKNKKIDVTLYSASGFTLDDGKYMIVGGGTKALAGDGSAPSFTTSFTSRNTALASAIWSKNAGQWSQGSNYLNLSSSLVGSQNNISVSIARAGKDGLLLAMNGGRYLTYNGTAFSVGDIHAGTVNLYRVQESKVFEMSFSNEQQGQTITSVEQPGMTFDIN
jgi:hypothetical protein